MPDAYLYYYLKEENPEQATMRLRDALKRATGQDHAIHDAVSQEGIAAYLRWQEPGKAAILDENDIEKVAISVSAELNRKTCLDPNFGRYWVNGRVPYVQQGEPKRLVYILY